MFKARMREYNRSHLRIAGLLNVPAATATLACRNITETNYMTSNMTSSEATMSPELN
jgi:hypothetical protein